MISALNSCINYHLIVVPQVKFTSGIKYIISYMQSNPPPYTTLKSSNTPPILSQFSPRGSYLRELPKKKCEEELKDSPFPMIPLLRPKPTSEHEQEVHHYNFKLPHHNHEQQNPEVNASEYLESGGISPQLHKSPRVNKMFEHPERLSSEERESMIQFVPKDTIELLKEGHTEYFIK